MSKTKELYSAQTNINLQDESGWTPLISCVSKNNEQVVQFLLSCPEIKVNLQNETGRTALHYAASKNYLKLVQMLLEDTKIDVDIQDSCK